MGQAQPTLVVECPLAAQCLTSAGGGKCFELEWSIASNGLSANFAMYTALAFQLRHNNESTTYCMYDSQVLYVRLAKMSRVFNTRITGQAATDSAPVFNFSSLGGAQSTLAIRYRPAAYPSERARGMGASVSTWSENLQKKRFGRSSEFISPKG